MNERLLSVPVVALLIGFFSTFAYGETNAMNNAATNAPDIKVSLHSTGNQSGANPFSNLKLSSDSLPGLIIAATSHSEFSWQHAEGDFDKVLSMFDDYWHTNGILSGTLGLRYLVQNQYSGQRYGMAKQNWFNEQTMWANRMFVTEPIASFRGRSLVIISQLSPVETWILAIETNLQPIMVFNNYVRMAEPPLTVTTDVTHDALVPELYVWLVEEVVYEGEGRYNLINLDTRYSICREIELFAQDDHVSLRQIRESQLDGMNPYTKSKPQHFDGLPTGK
jgi:hypothetical protein